MKNREKFFHFFFLTFSIYICLYFIVIYYQKFGFLWLQFYYHRCSSFDLFQKECSQKSILLIFISIVALWFNLWRWGRIIFPFHFFLFFFFSKIPKKNLSKKKHKSKKNKKRQMNGFFSFKSNEFIIFEIFLKWNEKKIKKQKLFFFNWNL